MDEALALRLIHPIRVGEAVWDGWSLVAIDLRPHEADFRRDAIHLVFSQGFSLAITHRSDAAAAFRTRHFNVVVCHSEVVLSDAQKGILDLLRERIETNDTQPPRDWRALIGEGGVPEGPARFWVIPGHIGNPLDMSIRSLRVLQTIELMFIEEGAIDDVRRVFERFSLGPLPRIVQVREDEADIERQLRTGIAGGLTMALFGAGEGAPGICDPGWMVLAALRRVGPDIQVRSTSGGSALTTAMMHLVQPNSTFIFLGLFKWDSGHVTLLDALRYIGPLSRELPLVCFATGGELQREWSRLCRACTGLNGRLSLFRNLTRPDEAVAHFALSELTAADPSFMKPDDKVVVRFELKLQLNPVQWLRRLIWRR